MLRYGAAACLAAIILAWPACAGSETDTFWSTPSAAVLASATPTAPAPVVASLEPSAAPILAPAQQRDVPAAAVDPNNQTQPMVQQPTTPSAAVKLADQAEPPAQDDPHLVIGNRTALIEPVEPNLPPVTPSPPVALPFGLSATPIPFGGVVTKWRGVEVKIRHDKEILAHCDADPQHCSKAVQNFLAIVAQGRGRSGLARIGTINRAVNLAIEPMSDMAQWGVEDRWSNPLETFTTGRGDCEDYAIAKYVALTAAGVAPEDVKLVIVRNTALNQDHAVTAVRDDDRWIILDNRWLTMVQDVAMAKAVPRFVLDDAGVQAFAAPVLIVARDTAAPASVPY
ncbi:MAG: transglutaminase-like cysteine peptidase [Xanthobacteraceae bacterium]